MLYRMYIVIYILSIYIEPEICIYIYIYIYIYMLCCEIYSFVVCVPIFYGKSTEYR